MAVFQYKTKDADVLDDICVHFYDAPDKGVKVLQQILLANPGLAELGTVYRAGVVINLPDIVDPDVKPINRPWGRVG